MYKRARQKNITSSGVIVFIILFSPILPVILGCHFGEERFCLLADTMKLLWEIFFLKSVGAELFAIHLTHPVGFLVRYKEYQAL